MKTSNVDQNSRTRILETAESVFAEKGYDGARMDEIASRAGVNKALIYYYFESKQHLLEVLFRSVIEDSIALTERILDENAVNADTFPGSMPIDVFLETVLDFLEQRQKTIRIMLMESLKKNSMKDLIFDMIDEMLQAQIKSMKLLSMPTYDVSAVLVTEFFSGMMPIINFVVYHDVWMERYKIDEPSLRAMFIKMFRGTHVAYTLGSQDPEQ